MISKRNFLFALVVATSLLATSDARFVYTGTYGSGIVTYLMNQTDGSLKEVSRTNAQSPSSVSAHPNGKFLYSTSELAQGAFESWKMERNGQLTKLNSVSSNGNSPAHLSVHTSGQFLLGSNYGSGNFLVFALNSDGTIGKKLMDVVPGTAQGSVPDRQEGPHAHQIVTSPNGNIIGVDLGADKIFSWDLDVNSKKIKASRVPYAQVLSGSGCRHVVFHSRLGTAYVINEMGNSVDSFTYSTKTGAFKAFQHISTLPQVFDGDSAGAEIRIHPNGKYLYGTNRGSDSIVTFEINQINGKLNVVGWTSSFGSFPRGMNISPSGRFMYVGNQKGNNVVVFQIQDDGRTLTKRSEIDSINSPVDFVFSAY